MLMRRRLKHEFEILLLYRGNFAQVQLSRQPIRRNQDGLRYLWSQMSQTLGRFLKHECYDKQLIL